MSSSETLIALDADASSTLACFLLLNELRDENHKWRKPQMKKKDLPCIFQQILEESWDNPKFGGLLFEILQSCDMSFILLLIDILRELDLLAWSCGPFIKTVFDLKGQINERWLKLIEITYHCQDKGESHYRQLATTRELRMDYTIILCVSEPCIVDDRLYERGHIHPCFRRRILKRK